MGVINYSPYQYIYIDNQCAREIRKISDGFGKAKKFNNWFAAQVKILNDPEINFLSEYIKKFEHITEDIYCITYRHKVKNIRILFQLFSDSSNIKLLLCGFEEKNKSDYDKSIKIAKRRRNQTL